MDIAKTKRLSEDNVNALINSMFTSAGFENKESLNYDDFKTMMKEFKGKEIYISFNGLDLQLNYKNIVCQLFTTFLYFQPKLVERNLSNVLT